MRFREHPEALSQTRWRSTALLKFIGLALTLTLGLTGASADWQVGYTVVVNPANPTSALTKHDISNLFLRKVTKWPNGAVIHPIDLASNSPVRADFSRDIHRKSIASISAYWQQQIFSGRAVPPTEKASETDVIAYVRSDSAAIGYLSAGAAPPGLKVIQVLP